MEQPGVQQTRPSRSLWADSFGRTAVRSAQSLIVLTLAGCVVYALVQLKLVVIPVLVATIVAAAVSPVVTFLKRKGLPAALATWAAMITGLGTLGLTLWLVWRNIRDESEQLVASATEGLDELQTFLTDGPLGLSDAQITEARESAQDLLGSESVQNGALAGATAAAEVLTGLLLGAVILFFLLKDGRRIFEFFLRPLDARHEKRAERIGLHSVRVLGGYVRGTALVALVDTVVIGAALLILGVPLALSLATIVFLGAFVPLIGATVAGILAALVALVANGPVTALIVIVVVIAVNQLEGDFLAPVVIGKALSLHPLVILLALTVGTILAGIVGALLSVPIAAVGWTIVTEWNASNQESDDVPAIDEQHDLDDDSVTA
ncbi:AI-2E family transporter [Sanguibacter antarcticus]|uniref:Putative PurR-regulated permease PerM n=1 Tax=Sanguibacter antarcticus TaxID=372484 RepID=A0A2A9E3P1_9MICO|nr:AI-2E family transporter [Sanguibacter antarcticus]PFG33191.1 putative PurR-regulated permease PerM [Sanguibacter antarcticus]